MAIHVLKGSERQLLKGAKSLGKADPAERLEVSVLLRRKGGDNAFSSKIKALHSAGGPPEPMKREAFAQEFGADPNIIGKTLLLDNDPYQVVGVMPRGFAFPADEHNPQVWTPAEIDAKSRLRNYDALWFNVIARRKNGVSLGEPPQPATAKITEKTAARVIAAPSRCCREPGS